MKKCYVIVFLFFAAYTLPAQNVAINTDATAAHNSSILDVKSTTRGMLMPRMTSVERGAIVSPALGLMVFDTDTKTIWAYDGSAWKNLVSSGGLVLPFSQTVNTGVSAFHIGNQGMGSAIEGSSSAEYGTGVSAKATGAGSWGLYAFTNGAGAKSINAFADNGTAIHGENNNAANTNTLLSLLNRGAGKTATLQLLNSTSTSANMQIAGNNLGEQLVVFQTNASNTSAAVSINNSGNGAGLFSTTTTGIGVSAVSSTNHAVKGVTNSSTGFAGIYGQNTGTQGNGVYGISNLAGTNGVSGYSSNGTGIRGESNTGAGMLAYSGSGLGINAGSLSGTGIYTTSISGLALHVNGNLRVSGGNTNPAAGAVLTSDANGNASWQQPVLPAPRVAFRASGASTAETNGTANNSFSNSTFKKVEFSSESYDLNGNFSPTGNSASTTNSSSFLIPLNGVYHFDANVKTEDNTLFDYLKVELQLKLRRGGVVSVIAHKSLSIDYLVGSSISISTDVSLLANDRVWVEFKQNNWSFTSCSLETSGTFSYFTGHLLFTQ